MCENGKKQQILRGFTKEKYLQFDYLLNICREYECES